MPLPFHLIDGYNLLHIAGLARETYGPGDYERARFALLIRIADGLDDAARERTTVVFDAFEPPIDAAPQFRFREMTVRFAVESGEADALIETLIRRHSSPRQLRVVSDDVRIKQAAKRRGAAAVSCEAFLRRLERYASAGRRPADRPTAGDSTTGSTGEWLNYFGLPEGALDPARLLPEDAPPHRPSTAQRRDRPSMSERRPASPAAPKASSAVPARPGEKAPRLDEPDSEPAAEDLAFWQRRIDEALAEERRRGTRPGGGASSAESS